MTRHQHILSDYRHQQNGEKVIIGDNFMKIQKPRILLQQLIKFLLFVK